MNYGFDLAMLLFCFIALREKSMCSIEAHSTDVNVISWNKKVSHLLVSGADDGSIKIWDLRNFKKDSPAAHFTWHKQAITAVSWHPQDEVRFLLPSTH